MIRVYVYSKLDKFSFVNEIPDNYNEFVWRNGWLDKDGHKCMLWEKYKEILTMIHNVNARIAL